MSIYSATIVMKVKSLKMCIIFRKLLLRCFVQTGVNDDEFVLFVTDEAYNKNWIAGRSYEGEDIGGLKALLNRFVQGKGITIKPVKISNAQNENDIWSIFEAVVDSVNDGDEIIVDITHAFRSIPMLAVVMINYLQVVRNVSFKGLYYGAIESLGRIQDIAKKDKKDRNAPIIDLSSFIYLLQFSNAVNNFMKYGDARELSMIALNEVDPILKQSQGKDELAKRIKGVSNQLKSMTQNFAYCRGKDIINFDYANLYNTIITLIESFNSSLLTLKPLQPLLHKLLQKLDSFKDYDNIINPKKGILAAQWCLEHNLIQQSITILQESIITLVCYRHKLDYKIFSNTVRVIRKDQRQRGIPIYTEMTSSYYTDKKEFIAEGEITIDEKGLQRFFDTNKFGSFVGNIEIIKQSLHDFSHQILNNKNRPVKKEIKDTIEEVCKSNDLIPLRLGRFTQIESKTFKIKINKKKCTIGRY